MKLFILLIILLIVGVGFLASSKAPKKKERLSVQDSLNLLDINQCFTYTEDHYVIAFLQISGRKTDLLSDTEQRALTKRLTADLATLDFSWQILALSQPEDNSAIIYQYQTMLEATSNPVRKKLLREGILYQNNLMLSGMNTERQFYIKLWEVDQDGAESALMDKMNQISKCFEGGGYTASFLYKSSIIQLNNLINNPSALIYENDMDTGVLPRLEGYHEV